MAAIGRKGGKIGGKRRLPDNDQSPMQKSDCKGRQKSLEEGSD